MEHEVHERFLKLLKSFDSAVLVTHSTTRGLHARPMAIAEMESNGDLWFITGRETAKVHEIQQNKEVEIVCQEGERKFVCLKGRAQLVEDRLKVQEIWKEPFRTWFPDGPSDPDICLIHVRGEEAEFWDTSGMKGLRYMFSAATAYAKGERPEIDEGRQHGRVNMKTA